MLRPPRPAPSARGEAAAEQSRGAEGNGQRLAAAVAAAQAGEEPRLRLRRLRTCGGGTRRIAIWVPSARKLVEAVLPARVGRVGAEDEGAEAELGHRRDQMRTPGPSPGIQLGRQLDPDVRVDAPVEDLASRRS